MPGFPGFGQPLGQPPKAAEAMATAPRFRCPNCGKEIPKDSQYCPSCGKQLKE